VGGLRFPNLLWIGLMIDGLSIDRFTPNLGRLASASAEGSERVKAPKVDYPDFFTINDTTLPVLLSLFVDGFNPHDSGTYSVWVMTVHILNLPPEVGRLQK